MSHIFAKTIVAISTVAAMAQPAFAQSAEDRLQTIEAKLDAALAEIERLKAGAPAASTSADALRSRLGFAPAASKVYNVAGGPSFGGYGEVLLENFDRTRENGTLAGRPDRIDLYRAVFYIGHKFGDEIVFNSEIEWEHAGVYDEAPVEVDPATGEGAAELSGEAIVEFAYLDWSRRREFGVRAGRVLVPMGLVNEWHEPPVFIGARRPDVESRIIPSTWAALGAGVFGEFANGLSYRAYLLEGLDGAHFSASRAIRGGRQGSSLALATKPSIAARLDWDVPGGLRVGVAGYRGDVWQAPPPAGGPIAPSVTMFDVHARWQWRGLDARALYAHGRLSGAGGLSDALGLAGSERLGESFGGAYVEAAYDALPAAFPGTRYGFAPYARFEVSDTQNRVPGGSESPENAKRTVTVGAAFKPHPSVVLKADRQLRTSDADSETSQWNMALGWMF